MKVVDIVPCPSTPWNYLPLIQSFPHSLPDLNFRLSLWRFRNGRVKGKEIHCDLLRVKLLEDKRKASCYEEGPVLSRPLIWNSYGEGVAKPARGFPKRLLKS